MSRLNKYLITFIFSSLAAFSQDSLKIDAFVEIVSAYNYRAIDYGNSPAVQPRVSFYYNNFEFTAWGSQALISRVKANENSEELVPFTELDLLLKYHLKSSLGTFIFGFADYYYPYKHKKFFNYKGLEGDSSAGSHFLNVSLEYILSQDFPLKLILDYNMYNDYQKPIYFEASYQFYYNEFIIEPYLGLVKGLGQDGITEQYGVDKDVIGLCNLGFNVTKTIPITESFKLPITISLSMQPYTEMAWLVFKAKI